MSTVMSTRGPWCAHTFGRDGAVQQVAAVLRPRQVLAMAGQHDAQELFLQVQECMAHGKRVDVLRFDPPLKQDSYGSGV
jgi:hypothetical protein